MQQSVANLRSLCNIISHQPGGQFITRLTQTSKQVKTTAIGLLMVQSVMPCQPDIWEGIRAYGAVDVTGR